MGDTIKELFNKDIEMIYELLRKEMGYNHLIISDYKVVIKPRREWNNCVRSR
jgi:hypothetical protein